MSLARILSDRDEARTTLESARTELERLKSAVEEISD